MVVVDLKICRWKEDSCSYFIPWSYFMFNTITNMGTNFTLVALMIIFTCTLGNVETPAPTTRPAATFDSTDSYRSQVIEGWKVRVNLKLLEQENLCKETLAELQNQLHQITKKIPRDTLVKLKKITIWTELNGPVIGMCYHPSADWLKEHGFNPEKACGVELGNARNFVAWSQHQPCMVLHELAHAYHHQVLGYDHPRIKAAYKHAVESKIYENVLYYDGTHVKHYALTNDQEYFAESSEAFWGTNDYYPFVRAELKEHDQVMYQLLCEIWGKKPTTRTATKN